MKGDDARHKAYVSIAEAHEDQLDSDLSRREREDGAFELPEWLAHEVSRGSKDVAHGLVFWPESVLTRKRVEYNQEDLDAK